MRRIPATLSAVSSIISVPTNSCCFRLITRIGSSTGTVFFQPASLSTSCARSWWTIRTPLISRGGGRVLLADEGGAVRSALHFDAASDQTCGSRLARPGRNAQQPAAVRMPLRYPDPIEIFQDLNGQVSPDAAQAVEIGCGECAVGMPGGKLFGDPFQLIERRRQKIAIFCHPMHPAKLLGAGKKRFEGRESNFNLIDQFPHPRRAHAVGREGGRDAFPDGGFRGRRLCLVGGKVNDDAPARHYARRAKLRDGA